jgi:indole-3-glycerol phosphate synthase
MSGDLGMLGEIVARSRVRTAERRRELPLDRLLATAPTPGQRRAFAGMVSRSGRVNVIAEFKRRSPSRGPIREELEVTAVAEAYESAGAAALSILTEPDYFGGSLEDFRRARSATLLPALRKDFIVDAYQVWEAWAAGADAVLLIVAALSEAELGTLLATAREAALDALVEVHDAEELQRALSAGARLVGVNNRDLRTMEVSLATSIGLGPKIPDGVVAVAESGIRSGDDVRRLRDVGFDAVLVGEHLMRSPDPGAALSVLIDEASATRPEKGES